MVIQDKQDNECHKISLKVSNETSKLTKVIVGIAADLGATRNINPKAAAAIRDDIYPSEQDLTIQLNELEKTLTANGIHVLNPRNIKNVNQIFVRDLGFVIDDCFVICNLFEEVRMPEINGISHLLEMIEPNKLVHLPREVTIEGGDIVQYDDVIFVGLGKRTNKEAIYFLRNLLPHKTIIPLELRINESDPYTNILHLDCAFQPVGERSTLLYQDGFKSNPTDILDIFSDQVIHVTAEEMYHMAPNILSIDRRKVISCSSFIRVNRILSEQGIDVTAIPFKAVSMLGGLLRCSTLPLNRA